MNEIYPVAKLPRQILLINKDDLPYIGKERALEVKCIMIDFDHKSIDAPIELEKHLKFNPWEEISEAERREFLQKLGAIFSDEDILEKIIKPLLENLVKI